MMLHRDYKHALGVSAGANVGRAPADVISGLGAKIAIYWSVLTTVRIVERASPAFLACHLANAVNPTFQPIVLSLRAVRLAIAMDMATV